MRIALAVLFVLAIVTTAVSRLAARPAADDGMIVPGHRIGLARVGMSAGEIEALQCGVEFRP